MIVTISRAYGAAANVVAVELAARLAYRVVSEDLPEVIAGRLGSSAELVDGIEGTTPALAERLLRGFVAVPEMGISLATPQDEYATAYRREIEDVVRDEATRGDAIIVGRAANAILGRRPDLLSVFLTAPLGWRTEYVAASLGVDLAHAAAEIARIDKARRAYTRDQYKTTWGDRRNYDLLLDTARFGVEGAAEMIVTALRLVQRSA